MNDDAPRGVPAAANEQAPVPASAETSPSSAALSRLATDFGLPESSNTAPDLLVGTELGDVHIVRLIAQGGMGRVYEARQRHPARTVAVKVMRPATRSPSARLRFHREAEVLGRLRHPGIAQIFTAATHRAARGETPYFVMEFVPSAESLVAFCKGRGLTVRERLPLFRAVCDAVGHGHAHGIVHRDLKPGNILVGGDGRPKVIDFGIARLTDGVEDEESCTETGQFVGTRQYTSPEQFSGGQVDARSDVYALGVILHELLSDRLPHSVEGLSIADTARVIRDEPPRRLMIDDAGLREGIAAIAATCLAKKPDDRYATAGELGADLDRLMAGEPLTARSPGIGHFFSRWRRPKSLLAGAVSIACLAGGMVAAVLISGRGSAPANGARSDVPDRLGPRASFDSVSSGRTTPVRWIGLRFDDDVATVGPADFTLTHDGVRVAIDGVTVEGGGRYWKVGNLEPHNAAEGIYALELVGTGSSPCDLAGNRLLNTARAVWRMPPYREWAFNLLDEAWRSHIVEMTDVECYTERAAGSTTFIRPTVPGKEGAVVMRFEMPFRIHSAILVAGLAVWTTGDPFPYDPGARAALDVSPDGDHWTTVASLEAGRGGFNHGPHDITAVVTGGSAVWVRSRLTATREWPGDGMIFAQFLRSDPKIPEPNFILSAAGPHPPVIPRPSAR